MVGTTDLALIRDRDAQAAIRGFVYQIDLTLLRWFKLEDADLLLPERAEDIDLLAQWMNGGNEQLLEQVKHLSGNITLNTPAVRRALAGFYEHRVANPDTQLRFRFSTNARVVRERTSHFDDKAPGIQAWNNERSSATTSVVRLAGLRRTLAEGTQPDDLAAKTWDAFVAFVKESPDERLSEFVRTVEFSCGLAGDLETRSLAIEALASIGCGPDSGQAELAYLALFHHVVRLLCSDPPRELRRADIAPIVETAYSTSPRVAMALRLLSERVGVVEMELRDHAKRLLHAEASLNLTFTTPHDLTRPPPAPAVEIDRTALAEKLLAEFQPSRLVAVTGQLGMGKTQLVRFACARLNLPLAWLRLRGVRPEEASLNLARVIEFFNGRQPPQILVLDDMPPFNFESEGLRDLIVALLSDRHWNAVRFVSTTAGVHSTHALAAFRTATLVSFVTPNLSLAEAVSYVRALGGSPNEVAMEYLLQLTGGHPQMFVAVCRYLADNNWALETKTIAGLLERRFADGLTAETAQRFIATVRDDSTRELVYRMRVCMRRAGPRQLQALSLVEPRVGEPLTRVATLDGVWLQQDRDREWVVSPLLQSLSVDALPEARQAACHAALAYSFDDGRALNALDICMVLTHMREGRLLDDFVELYKNAAIQALALIRRRGAEAQVARFVLRGLASLSHPVEVAYEDAIVLDAIRLAAQLQLGQKVKPEAVKRVVDARLPETSTLLVATTLGFLLRGRDAMRLFRCAFNTFKVQTELQRQKLRLFVTLGAQTDDIAGSQAWFDMLPDFSPEERDQIDSDPMWPTCLMGVFEENSDRNKPPIQLELARSAAERSRQLKMSMFCAISVRAQAFALAGTDYDGALSLLGRAAEDCPENARERGLLLSAVVQLAVRHHQEERAFEAATSAMSCSTFGVEFQAAQCGVRGSIAASRLGRDGVPFARHAVTASRAAERVPPAFTVRALGEFGIAEWVAGHQGAAIRALVECADRLLALGQSEEEWKQLIPVAVHVLNFVAAQMRGVTPTITGDGTPYARPTPGQFFSADGRLEMAYREDQPLVLAALVVALAAGIGDMSTSERVAARFTDRLHSASARARIVVAMSAGPYLASRGLIQELIGCAWSSLDELNIVDAPTHLSGWTERDRTVLYFGFPHAVMGVGLALLDSSQSGQERAAELARALRELDVRGSLAGWSHVASLVEMIVSMTSSLSEAVQATQTHRDGLVQSVLMVLLSFHRQATPEFVARTQALALPNIWSLFRREPDAADVLLVPLLRGYWVSVVEQQSFRFRRADELVRDLAGGAMLDSVGARIYALVRSVLDSLGIVVEFQRSIFVEVVPSL